MASHVCLCSKWAKPRRKGCVYNPSSTLRPPSPQFKQLLDTLFNFTMVFFCTKEKGSGCFSLTVLFLDTERETNPIYQQSSDQSLLQASVCGHAPQDRYLTGSLSEHTAENELANGAPHVLTQVPKRTIPKKFTAKVPNKTTHLCMIKRQRTLLTGGYCGKLQRSQSFFRWLGLRSAHHAEHELGYLFFCFLSQRKWVSQ